jgi:hypothetical protein
MDQFPPGPEYPIGPLRILTKISEDIRNFVFIGGFVDTDDKLFTGIDDTGDEFDVVTTGDKLIIGVNDTG